jgi:hypothetical protein
VQSDQPRTVREVLEHVERNWSDLHAVLSGLSENQLVEPGPEGWSVKDHLAHILAWDRVPSTIVSGQPQWVAFGLDQSTYDRIDSVDQLNALIYERHRHRPLADVQAELSSVHAQLVEAIAGLADADLDRAIADFGSDPTDQRPLRDKIEGDCWGHYAEHTTWLRELRSVIEAG